MKKEVADIVQRGPLAQIDELEKDLIWRCRYNVYIIYQLIFFGKKVVSSVVVLCCFVVSLFIMIVTVFWCRIRGHMIYLSIYSFSTPPFLLLALSLFFSPLTLRLPLHVPPSLPPSLPLPLPSSLSPSPSCPVSLTLC